MESSQERLFPPWKPPKNLNARSTASCATSSASCSLRVSQRAKLYAASKCGIIVSSKRACLSCSSNRLSLPCGSRPLFKTDVPRSLFPSSSLFIQEYSTSLAGMYEWKRGRCHRSVQTDPPQGHFKLTHPGGGWF